MMIALAMIYYTW